MPLFSKSQRGGAKTEFFGLGIAILQIMRIRFMPNAYQFILNALFYAILCISAKSLASELVASPVIWVSSQQEGHGVLVMLGDQVAVLTNSHILKGKQKANISIPLVISQGSGRITYQNLKFHQNLHLEARVIPGSDDPIGDIVLLRFSPELDKKNS